MLQFYCVYFTFSIFASAHTTADKDHSNETYFLWLLVGVVVMNNRAVDVEPKSCPHSSNECFHALMRVKVVHILLQIACSRI